MAPLINEIMIKIKSRSMKYDVNLQMCVKFDVY